MITCESIYGNTVLLPREKLVFRASVYAVTLWEGKVLVLRSRSVGKYCFPGGGIDLGERIEDALRREVKEETGIEIKVERFLHFKEHFFYYDPLDEAFHSFMVFYRCRPRTLALVTDDAVDDGEVEKPRWMDLKELAVEDFQAPLQEVYRVVHRELG